MMTVILVLIMLMAVGSGFNKHPDEKDHYGAAKYYVHHWLPPAVGAPESAGSYSKYGYSYLNEFDFVYLLAAKFSYLISPFNLKKYLAMRLFNVFLFFLLILYCKFNRESRPILLCVLISPQIWYIFSYFNNDAISLFVSLILICELMNEDSLLQKSLTKTEGHYIIWVSIFFGLLLGILLLSKRNYYVFILFILMIISWQLWQNRGPSRRQLLLRYLVIIAIGLSVFLLRYGYDVAVNGWDKTGKIVAYAERVAEPQFKPSLGASPSSYYGLGLRAKGLSYWGLFSKKWRWHEKSFESFFGEYDYMKIRSSSTYYRTVCFFMSLFLIYIASVVLSKGAGADKIFLAMVWGFMLFMIFLSTYHSWVRRFSGPR